MNEFEITEWLHERDRARRLGHDEPMHDEEFDPTDEWRQRG